MRYLFNVMSKLTVFNPSTLLRWYLDRLLDLGMWLGMPCGLDALCKPCKAAGAVDDNAWWFPGTGLCFPFCLLPSLVFCNLCLIYCKEIRIHKCRQY